MSSSLSRDDILNRFQGITGLNFEDSIHFLDQYNWQLKDIVKDFQNGKEFKRKPNQHSSDKIEKKEFQQNPSHNAYNFQMKNDAKQQPSVDNDRHYADIVRIYGDQDESARKQWREKQQQQQHQPQQQLQHQPQQQQKSKGDAKHEPIYHERQQFLRCGLHALNNLFQIPNLFSHEHLDNLVREFDRGNNSDDYGKLWMGDYDLRILIEAIKRFGYNVRQINFYNGESLKNLPWDYYVGLLLNVNGEHWFTIKKLNGIYYNLNSTYKKPKEIGQKEQLVNYLIDIIQHVKNAYVFAVLEQTKEEYH